LTTRVKEPDHDNWRKLIRLLSYLKNTENLHFNLNCRDIKSLIWYIEGSHATYDDMKGLSGAVLITGDCAVIFRSNKQKINTRSSTKSELIAVDDAPPSIQWARNFYVGARV
jgi:hypothetical protein